MDKTNEELFNLLRELLTALTDINAKNALHIDRLTKLQEDSAERFIKTNEMVCKLVSVADAQREQMANLSDRLDRMTTLHAEQAYQIRELVESNTRQSQQTLEVYKEHERRLADLIAMLGNKPQNIIQ